MSSTMAVSLSQSRPDRMVGIEREIFRAAALADLRWIEWIPPTPLLEYKLEEDPVFAQEVPEVVRVMEIADPLTFLQSFTRDPSIRQRVPPNLLGRMNFTEFTRELMEPYILTEITRKIQEAEKYLTLFCEDQQHAFETAMIENASRWMEHQRKAYRQLAMSDEMIRKRVSALERAAREGHSIDAENDIVMIQAPPIPIKETPQYAAEIAAVMIDEKWEPWLNQLGLQNLQQQEQIANLQKQVAEAARRESPLDRAFSESIVSSRTSTPRVRVLRSSRGRVRKASSITSGASRQPSPQPLPATVPETPIVRLRPYLPQW